MTDWQRAKSENNWTMPPSPGWQRLPIIRHVRAIYSVFMIERHYAYFPHLLRSGYDAWVLHGIWKGYQ